ncbi:VanZ family protein [Sutcliffiella horikoshii]|uniref:VanZ family protein n=1 Tax=Sutcliffiella horikoshii TaxID=79883 RepID=A0A5D4T4G9_9BACI|nr:VanZ family protein [Sutcliffiella horikoshii]TYS69801.1 VanZ family protein [Sutcliffiella horikoshii]
MQLQLQKKMIAVISWALVVGWMALIFFLSAQHAEQSADLSGGITELVNEVVEQVAPDAEFHIDEISFFVRKNAHFFAYMLLAVLTLNAVRRSGGRGWLSMGVAFIISVLYAISDEVHQLFVPGRSGQVSDVLLDSMGALVGIALYSLISRWLGRRNKAPKNIRAN